LLFDGDRSAGGQTASRFGLLPPVAKGASPLEASGDEATRVESAVSVRGGENTAKVSAALT